MTWGRPPSLELSVSVYLYLLLFRSAQTYANLGGHAEEWEGKKRNEREGVEERKTTKEDGGER